MISKFFLVKILKKNPKNYYFVIIQFHGSLILGFAILNLYLHCGYTFDWVEWLLPRLLFNTSDFHNYHHLKVNINFGELGCLWDLIRGTGATVYNKEKFEAENPKYARKLKQGWNLQIIISYFILKFNEKMLPKKQVEIRVNNFIPSW